MDDETFRALCIKIADEKDPKKLELLKERVRLLLRAEDSPRTPRGRCRGSL
jgi:hypothetical protein